MKHGFVKVCAATPEIKVADCAYNEKQLAQLARGAHKLGAKLLVFPELCLTGYTCGDLFLQSSLREGALAALSALLEDTKALDTLIVVGAPIEHSGKLYNCGVALCRGEVLGVVPKTHLPNYGEFYEQRHFVPAPAEPGEITLFGKTVPFGTDLIFRSAECEDFSVAVEICEDLWSAAPPSIRHAQAGAHIIANLSASDELVSKAAYRRNLVAGQSARLVCAYVYADAGEGESTTDVVFAGHNLIAEDGALLAESARFTTGLTATEVDVGRIRQERLRMMSFPPRESRGYREIPFHVAAADTHLTRHVNPYPFIAEDPDTQAENCEEILSIQAAGLRKRWAHTRARGLYIGVSGGLDSALALLVAVRCADTLGKPRSSIRAVTMPCFGTTRRTRDNAGLLCDSLGIELQEIRIADAVTQHFRDIGLDSACRDVAYENSQARERTQVLMDMANMDGGLVVGTGDLSELALGWATYNGDHMSMYGVNASVPKTLVRSLVAYEAARTGGELERVLRDILDTPVSPELLPAQDDGEIAQKTEDIVGPYELHDFFLYYAVRWGFEPEKILLLAQRAFDGMYSKEVLVHWLKNFYRRFFSQQFKRSCMPDGPKVGSVALSPRGDWRMPSDACAALWLSQVEQL